MINDTYADLGRKNQHKALLKLFPIQLATQYASYIVTLGKQYVSYSYSCMTGNLKYYAANKLLEPT